MRNVLAVTEVALALVLLTGAALMAQSIIRQLRVDAGFRTDHLLTAKLHLDPTNYRKETRKEYSSRSCSQLYALSREWTGWHQQCQP